MITLADAARTIPSVLSPTLLIAASVAFGHGPAAGPPGGEPGDRAIQFPDTPGYQTLVVDLHTHTVFSDGHVWPSIRVEEALRDALDAVAITDHLEYQPHLLDIPHPDRNRPFQEAATAAAETGVLVIPGAEITRAAPAGHMNAVFIEDANRLFEVSRLPDDRSDPIAYYRAAAAWPAQQAVEAANDQGGFVFWNHSWGTDIFPNGVPVIPEFHAQNASEGLLHGIEIANGQSYSAEAFQIALDHDLTLIGVSDVHELVDWDYEPHQGGHRPVTLVFTNDRTADGIKDALFDQRTVVWYKNLLAGRARELVPLLEASVTLDDAEYRDDTEVLTVTLSNHSDADLQLRNRTSYTLADHPDIVELGAHRRMELQIKTGTILSRVELQFDVLNALLAPGRPAPLTLVATTDE